MTIDHPEAVRRFAALGLKDAEQHLDPYTQGGIFGEIEEGKITDEEFRVALSSMIGKELSWQECQWAWLGYRKEVAKRNVDILKRLRKDGYRLIMLSNTNPYMMDWAMSSDFSLGLDDDCPEGKPASEYFDSVYLSYKLGVMKPDERFFAHVLENESINPEESLFVDDGPRNVQAAANLGLHTFCPNNGEPWDEALLLLLRNI